MTITDVGVTPPIAENSATQIILNVPAGVQAGDLMLTTIRVRQHNATAFTPPAGWTLVRESSATGGTSASHMREALFTRTAGGSEPASYQWTGPAGLWQGAMVVRRGAVLVGDAVVAANHNASATHTGPAATPSATVAGARALTFSSCGYAPTSPAWTDAGAELWTDDATAARFMAVETSGLALTSGTPYTPPALTHGSTNHAYVSITALLAPLPPDVPADLAVDPGETDADVTWSAAAGASGYDVRLNGVTVIATGADLAHQLTDLDYSTAYTLEVRATGDGGTSAWSAPVDFTTDTPAVLPLPPVADATLRLYLRLPEHYREADIGLGYPLLRYLSLLLDQLDPLDELVARIDYDAEDGGTSDLVDADTANARWLPWLAQLLGVNIADLTIAEQRVALANPETSWDHGTPGAIADAAKRGLTGTKAVTITPHQGGNPYVIGIGTLDSETATLDTFAELMAYAPTWAGLHALGTFAIAAAPAPLRAAEEERPAGYNLVRYSTGA